MVEQTGPQSEQTGTPNIPAQPKRSSTSTPSVGQPSTSVSSEHTNAQKCEVLKDSCKEDAKFKATFPSGSEVYSCAEHKQELVNNYPDQELVFEEVQK